MSSGLLVLVSAPSGAGKTSLVKHALDADTRLKVCVSHTTRGLRPGEQNGLNYHFVDRAQFREMIQAEAFLEYAEVFGNYYGTSHAEVQKLRDAGKDVILEIDWQGADQIRHLVPDALSIFILPPSEQALRERLTNRGQDSAEVIERRLAQAKEDMAQAGRYQYLVVNDNFEQAAEDFATILHSARLSYAYQVSAHPQIRALTGIETTN